MGIFISIHHEGGVNPLDSDVLADELIRTGFVVFSSSRTKQRAIAQAIDKKLDSKLKLRFGEANSPNSCMCMVDTARHDFHAIVDAAQKTDSALFDAL